MTDRELEQRLRLWYRTEIGEAERAPAALRMSVAAMPRSPSAPGRRLPPRFGSMGPITRLAAASIIAAVAIGAGVLLSRPNQTGQDGPSRSPTPGESASPSTGLSPSAFPPGAPSWSATGSMVTPRYSHVATLLGNGRVLVSGGYSRLDPPYPDNGLTASAELYDPSTGTWTATGSMVTRRDAFTTTLLHDGRVLAAGGMDPIVGDPMAVSELYDPATGTWTATVNMVTPCLDHAAVRLPDGRVLVVCGFDAPPELYDPESGSWTVSASMITPPAQGFTATLLPDGRVLVAGGRVERDASAEIYDPADGTWILTGNMVTPRIAHSATLLSDGKVLVTSGREPGGEFDGPALTVAELYDPDTGSWTATGSMVSPRALHQDACCEPLVLQDGTVFVPGDGIAPPQLYDPATGSWAAVESIGTPRNGSTATLLPDGGVLVTGGLAPGSGSVILGSAELYDPGSATR